MSIPKFDELFNPVLKAIKKLGGSASISELDEEVTKNLHVTDEEIADTHNERMTELQYRLAWARSYLKSYELIDNSERGIWVLTAKGKDVDTVDSRQVTRFVRNLRKGKSSKIIAKDAEAIVNVEIAEAKTILEETWREELTVRLLELSSDAFERLCQRLLRESGFVEVKVTGRDAKLEAIRDGAPPIDLVDGEQLLDKLKELRLGVIIKMIEQVSILPNFFNEI